MNFITKFSILIYNAKLFVIMSHKTVRIIRFLPPQPMRYLIIAEFEFVFLLILIIPKYGKLFPLIPFPGTMPMSMMVVGLVALSFGIPYSGSTSRRGLCIHRLLFSITR